MNAAPPRNNRLLFRDQRRRAVIRSTRRVGLDYLVAKSQGKTEDGVELWLLELRFLPGGRDKREAGVRPVPTGAGPANVRLTIGDLKDPGVRVFEVSEDAANPRVLKVRVRRDPRPDADSGPNVMVYTLELVDLPQVDRFFRSTQFAFVEQQLDLGPGAPPPPQTTRRKIPEIDYLAKDFESFRRLMLEQLQAFVPRWQEEHAADLGVTVVELLARSADYLSYYQDAVATEAYMATARQRISLRRHARLVNYRLHEGCNSRCWVQLKVERQPAEEGNEQRHGERMHLPAGIEVLTYSGHVAGHLERGSKEHYKALQREPMVFKTLHEAVVHPGLNRLQIYTWRAESFTLTAGSTQAAFETHLHGLKAGDVLIFERRSKSEETGEDIDPRERQAVRLCRDPRLTTDLAPDADAEPMAITEVEWFPEDALVADYPVSVRVGRKVLRELSLARGNVVLVDQGATVSEILEPVPANTTYAPVLKRIGLTHRQILAAEEGHHEPASSALTQDPREALPDILLYELGSGDLGPGGEELAPEVVADGSRFTWSPRHDLLASGRFARDFVVELNSDGRPHLRFGDDWNGRRPSPGTVFQAVYRVGQGPAGNVGAYALRHAVLPSEVIERGAKRGLYVLEAKNHLAGGGGLDREPMEKARIFAPEALRSRSALQRCVIEDDYVAIAERHSDVARAAARLRWTGSWNLAELFVQRPSDRPVDELFRRRLRRHMQPYLLAGWELEVSTPYFVPLDVRLTIWPQPSLDRENLPQKLRDRVAAGDLEILRPDYFTFGQSVFMSDVIAQLMALPEVADVQVDVFKRWGQPARGELEAAEIAIEPLEIALLENDPSKPHRGLLRVEIGESA